jgi:hypothetical protein
VPVEFEVRNRTTRGWFLLIFVSIFGSGESGKSSVSAEKVKNGACDNGFKVEYFD